MNRVQSLIAPKYVLIGLGISSLIYGMNNQAKEFNTTKQSISEIYMSKLEQEQHPTTTNKENIPYLLAVGSIAAGLTLKHIRKK